MNKESGNKLIQVGIIGTIVEQHKGSDLPLTRAGFKPIS